MFLALADTPESVPSAHRAGHPAADPDTTPSQTHSGEGSTHTLLGRGACLQVRAAPALPVLRSGSVTLRILTERRTPKSITDFGVLSGRRPGHPGRLPQNRTCVVHIRLFGTTGCYPRRRSADDLAVSQGRVSCFGATLFTQRALNRSSRETMPRLAKNATGRAWCVAAW